MYAKRTIECLSCGNVTEQSRHSSTGKFCSNVCQHTYQYHQYIKRWQAGEESGTSGSKGISLHVRRFIFEKFDSKCCICGWCEKHPVDGRIPLEVDHIDGNFQNTTELNLRLLCPNCHSLTPTYKSRNRGRSSRQYKSAPIA